MAEITHSPGPWKAASTWVVSDANDIPVAVTTLANDTPIVAAAPELLAYVKDLEFAIRLAGMEAERGAIYTDALALIEKCGEKPRGWG